MRAKQPTVAGRDLGAELRAIRMERKLSTHKVATQLGWAQSKMSKIETGKQQITPADVASLLAVYGITGHERDYLVTKAEKTDEMGLLEKTGAQGGLSRESRTLFRLEDKASAIFTLEMLLIPGLLQTPEYTRTVMKACCVPEEDTEVRVAARLGRQAILSRDEPPKLEAVLDEGALRRPILAPRLMVRQLRHLVEVAENANITIRVLRSSLGGHTGLDGTFTVLDFNKDKSVVHLEHKISGLFLEEDHELAFFRTEMARLRDVALEHDASVDFIATIAKELDPE